MAKPNFVRDKKINKGEEIKFFNTIIENVKNKFNIKFKNAYIDSSTFVEELKDDKLEINEYSYFGGFRGLWNYGKVVVVAFTLDSEESFIIKFTNLTEKEADMIVFGKEKGILEPGVYKLSATMSGVNPEKINLDDIGIKPILNDDLLKKIYNEIDAFIKKEDIYKENKVPHKRGILMYGPVGVGKTLTAKHILKSNPDAISILLNCSEDISFTKFVNDLVSDESSKDRLKIIILEDIDGFHPYHRSAILGMLDGIQGARKTIFIATTNYPHKLDDGLKNRPSRFDSYYSFNNPTSKTRMKFINNYFKEETKENKEKAVRETENFRGTHFKEIYLISKLEEVSMLKAINLLKDKFKVFSEFDDSKEQYFG